MNKPRYIIVHHSFTKDGTTKDWEAIRKYHMQTNGWSDIGYHFGIDEIGGALSIQVGRPQDQSGAHTKERDMNSKSIAICVIGNYDDNAPSEDRLGVLTGLCYQLMQKYSIPVDNILGHREVGKMAGFDWMKHEYKSCPGAKFDMSAFRDRLRNL